MTVRKKKKNTKPRQQSNRKTVSDFLARFLWFIGNTQESKNSVFRNLHYEFVNQVFINDLHSIGSMTGALVSENEIQTALASSHFSLITNCFANLPTKRVPSVSEARFAELMQSHTEDQEGIYKMHNEPLGLQFILDLFNSAVLECAKTGEVNKDLTAIAETEIPEELLKEEDDEGFCEEAGDIEEVALKKFLYRAPETSRIDIDTVIEMLSWMTIGVMPDSYYPGISCHYKEGRGNLNRDIASVDRIFFAPLVNRLAGVAHEADVLNSELLETAVTNANILTLSSAKGVEKAFRLYCPVYSGRAADIEKFISRDFKFSTLVTDGNRAFKTLVTNGHPEAKLQSSLFRFRREVIAALDECSIINTLLSLEDPEAGTEYIRKEILAANPYVLCLSVLCALTKIRTIRMIKAETVTDKVRFERMQCELMDHIDALMSELARDRIKRGKTVFVSVKASDLIGKACCCYMNQREMLREFMTDMSIPIDTETLATSVRPLAIVRSHPEFIENKDRAGLLFNVLSLFTSLQENGVKDPVAYVKSYAKELAAHIQKAKPEWNGISPNFGAELTEIRELTRDFDFDAWLPWNRKEA